MSERLPGLTIYRSAEGIRDEHVESMQAQLLKTERFEAVNIPRLFQLGNLGHRATILSPVELVGVFRYLKWQPNAEEVVELGDYVIKALLSRTKSAQGALKEVPVLPSILASIDPRKEKVRRKALGVARSDRVVRERHIAKRAVGEYLSDRIPAHLWHEDDWLAPVILARSIGSVKAEALVHLHGLLAQPLGIPKGIVLPSHVTLVPIRADVLDPDE